MEPNKLLNLQLKDNTKKLFVDFLTLIEDLHIDHSVNFRKLYEAIPSEYHDLISQADYFGEEKRKYLRKKVLDYGNNTIRNIENDSDKFIINFKFK